MWKARMYAWPAPHSKAPIELVSQERSKNTFWKYRVAYKLRDGRIKRNIFIGGPPDVPTNRYDMIDARCHHHRIIASAVDVNHSRSRSHRDELVQCIRMRIFNNIKKKPFKWTIGWKKMFEAILSFFNTSRTVRMMSMMFLVIDRTPGGMIYGGLHRSALSRSLRYDDYLFEWNGFFADIIFFFSDDLPTGVSSPENSFW